MKAVIENRPHHTLSESTRLVLNYSFVVAITYVVIFALAKIFNLEGYVELRFINYLLLFAICYTALKKLFLMNGKKIEYFYGISRTFLISMFGSLWYSILFFIYLHIDKPFLMELENVFPGKLIYPEMSISIVLFSEGLAMSAIVALALMQIFKKTQGRWARG